MRRVIIFGLTCLLGACRASLPDLFPDLPEKVAEFPATTAAVLSDCVYQSAQSLRSPYAFHLNARADKLEFVITATGNLDTTSLKLELHLMAKGESTIVEMKKSARRDRELSREIWSRVERCAQRMPERPAENTGPAEH
ncbi:MAG: hypothetical protein ABIU05_05080 [Nitrospirales bacterium]